MRKESDKEVPLILVIVHPPGCPHRPNKESARVSSGAVSEAFRVGHERIFGTRAVVGQA